MDENRLTFTQLPRQLPRHEYETARRRIVEEFDGREAVLGVYDYGTVEHPGISDLDVMLVVDGDASPSWLADLSSDFDPLVDELVGRGNIIVLDRDTFEQLNYVDPDLEPIHLAGDEIDLRPITDRAATFRDYASVMDWLPERVYQIERLHAADEIPVMRALQLLKSLGYSLRILDGVVDFPRGVTFVSQVESLRSNWFDRTERTRENDLLELIEEAMDVGREALSVWFATSPTRVIDGTSDRPGVLSYFDGLAYRTGEPGVDRLDGWTTIRVPPAWFDHWRVYAEQDGELGTLVRRSMVTPDYTPTALSSEYRSFLETKFEICAANFSWVRRRDLDAGAFRFGFLLSRTDWSDKQFDNLRAQLASLAPDQSVR